jgi:hypothetical protein
MATERPHGLTIGMSIAALVISLVSAALTWNESSKNRKLNESTSRAYLTISSLMLGVRTFYPSSNPQFNYTTGTITITNTGRTAAKQVRIERALLSSNSREPHTRQDEAIASIAEWPTFPPGSQVVRFKIPVLLSHGTFDRTDPQLTMSITIIYNDGVNVHDTVNDATWCAVKPQQPTIDFIQFYYCVDHAYEVHDNSH